MVPTCHNCRQTGHLRNQCPLILVGSMFIRGKVIFNFQRRSSCLCDLVHRIVFLILQNKKKGNEMKREPRHICFLQQQNHINGTPSVPPRIITTQAPYQMPQYHHRHPHYRHRFPRRAHPLSTVRTRTSQHSFQHLRYAIAVMN